jgi:hypothetical protein
LIHARPGFALGSTGLIRRGQSRREARSKNGLVMATMFMERTAASYGPGAEIGHHGFDQLSMSRR